MIEISFKSANDLYKAKKFKEALNLYREIANSKKYSENLRKSAAFCIQLTQKRLEEPKTNYSEGLSNRVIFVGSHSKYRTNFFDILTSQLEEEGLSLEIWDNLGTTKNWSFPNPNSVNIVDIRPEVQIFEGNLKDKNEKLFLNQAKKILTKFQEKYGESWLYSISTANDLLEIDISNFIINITIIKF